MKQIIKQKDGRAVAVKFECTATEALVLNDAMRIYADNEDINGIDRGIIRRMLEVPPIFEEMEDVEVIEVGDEVELYGTGSHAVVTSIDKYDNKNYYRCVNYRGELSTENDDFPPTKTGRHFSQIIEMLKQMQEVDGETIECECEGEE